MKNIKVGIQGIKASFHDAASAKFFNGTATDIFEFSSFPALGKSLGTGEIDFAVMAIENTIAGSLLPNYALMEKYHFNIIGEVYLRIKQNLMALPGIPIEKLRYIQSHPIAIQQCMEFLLQYPAIKILEVNDTAESARQIRDENLKEYGAIAGDLAAQAFGLEILFEEIETDKQNYTRFLVLTDKHEKKETAVDKASIRFEHAHRTGSLADILNIFKEYKINLTKIQSVPILGQPYEYSFHIDLEWEDYDQYKTAMEKVKKEVHSLTHFGEYKKGGKPFA